MSLERFVLWVMRDTRYHALYPATVELDHGEDRFDVALDDVDVVGRSFSNVPASYGLLGSSCSVQRGTRCLVGFADGDPKKPRVMAWEYRAQTAVVRLAGGTASVARKGDSVRVATLPAMTVSGVLGGTADVPNPSPPPPTIPTPVPPGSLFVGVVTIGVPVVGDIVGGARRLKA